MTKPKLKPETVRRRIDKAVAEFRVALHHYNLATMEFDRTVLALRERCPHDWIHSRDPSGGSDSFWQCRICTQHSRTKPEDAA